MELFEALMNMELWSDEWRHWALSVVGSSELFVATEYNNCYMSINIDEGRRWERSVIEISAS